MPTFVQLRVTNLCNLRCKMCGQWGDTGIFRSQSGRGRHRRRARARAHPGAHRRQAPARARRLRAPARRARAGAADHQPLRRRAAPLSRHPAARPRDQGARPDLHRHHQRRDGSRRSRASSSRAGIDSIAVSIDGPPDVHNRIRGRADSFEKAAAGVRAVARWRKEAEARPADADRDPSRDRAQHGRDRGRPSRRCASCPLDTINVGLRWFMPAERRRGVRARHARGLRRRGDLLEGLRLRLVRGRRRRRTRQMAELVKLLKGLRRRRFCGLDAREALDVVRSRRAGGARAGVLLELRRDVRPHAVPGRVVLRAGRAGRRGRPSAATSRTTSSATCAGRPSARSGAGEKAQKFRAKLAKEPLPICARCCGNFVYGKWERPERPSPRPCPAGRGSSQGAPSFQIPLPEAERARVRGDPSPAYDLKTSPEPVEVEPLRGVRADHALEVRRDARHDPDRVLVGRARRIAASGSPQTLK